MSNPVPLCPHCASPLEPLVNDWHVCRSCNVNYSADQLQKLERLASQANPFAGWRDCYDEDVLHRCIMGGGGSRSKSGRKKPTRKPFDKHDDPADRSAGPKRKSKLFVRAKARREQNEDKPTQIDGNGCPRAGAPEAILPKVANLRLSIPEAMWETLSQAASACSISVSTVLEALLYDAVVRPLV